MKSRWSRAFRDVLADLLPLEHSWAPTLRIAGFELLPWIYSAEAEPKMRELLAGRLEQPPRTRGVSSVTRESSINSSTPTARTTKGKRV